MHLCGRSARSNTTRSFALSAFDEPVAVANALGAMSARSALSVRMIGIRGLLAHEILGGNPIVEKARCVTV